MKQKILPTLLSSTAFQAAATCLLYIFYTSVFSVALVPSLAFVKFGNEYLLRSEIPMELFFRSALYISAVFLFFFCGIIVIGLVLRMLTLGITPGKYSMYSVVMVRWLVYSGLYHLAGKIILNYLPLSFISRFFFTLFGAKIGKNVSLNSWCLNDAFLMELGDNVVIGGNTDISCHTFEYGYLVLSRVKIGNNTLIGQRCYVSPGVTIGKNCVIGQFSLIRKNTTIPDRTVLTAIAGVPVRTAAYIEHRKFEPQLDAVQ